MDRFGHIKIKNFNMALKKVQTTSKGKLEEILAIFKNPSKYLTFFLNQ